MAEQRELTEAEKEALVPGVRFVDGAAGRRPRVMGPHGGLEVWVIVDIYHQEGDRREAIREVFPHLTEEGVDAGLHYYALFSEEIDAWIERNYSWTPASIERLNERHGVTRRSQTVASAPGAPERSE